MRFPIIKIHDNCVPEHKDRIIGTNGHDCLYIDENGAIQYLNTQCMRGTMYPDEGYSFVGVDMGECSISMRPEIEFMTLEQIIELVKDNMTESVDATIKSYYALKERQKARLEKRRQETGIKFDTGGLLPL